MMERTLLWKETAVQDWGKVGVMDPGTPVIVLAVSFVQKQTGLYNDTKAGTILTMKGKDTLNELTGYMYRSTVTMHH